MNKHNTDLDFSLMQDQGEGQQLLSRQQLGVDESAELLDEQQESEQKSNYKNENEDIDYKLNAVAYLSEVTKMVDRRLSRYSSGKESYVSKQELPDQQVQSIINEVLNKRRRISRMTNSNLSDYNHADIKKSGSANLLHIEAVNHRIRKENDELMNNVKKIASRLKKFTNFKLNENMANPNSKNESVQASQIVLHRQKELQKLKIRLEKAQKTHSKMQLQLSKLQQSRKSRKKSQSRFNVSKNQNNDHAALTNCPNCKGKESPPVHQQKFNSLRVQGDFSSPVRKDIYSPIMQFQQYSLKNQPTISLYDNSLQKTSQFGFQLPPQVYAKETQTEIDVSGLLEEQIGLDDQIIKLEEQIRKNNSAISKYQTVLIKQVF